MGINIRQQEVLSGNMSDYVGIEREIIELILQRKFFYGHFLQQFKRHNVDGKNINPSVGQIVKTLAVNITSDMKPNLYVNTDFYNSGDYDPDNPHAHTWGLTQEEKLAVLEHEILHILNKHIVRVENRDGYVWNLATDIAINQFLKSLPVGGICPDCGIFVRVIDKKFPEKCPLCKLELDPNLNKFTPLDIKDFKMLGDGILLENNNPSETYYDILWKKMPKQAIVLGRSITGARESEAQDGLPDSGDGEGEGEEGEGGGESGEGQGQGEKESKGKGSGDGKGDSKRGLGSGIIDINGTKVPVVWDNHEAWKAGSDNKEMAHHKIKDMVENTMHRVNQKSQGYLPDHLRKLIEQVLAHKTVNWKSELRKFVGYQEFSAFISSRKRLNRRFPIVQPGYVVQRKAHFVVAVDSSGSVSDEEFGKFFKEISIMHSAKIAITYVECDADIQLVAEYKKKPSVKIQRVGYGGTDFRPVFNFVKNKVYKNHRGEEFKLYKKVDGVIYLTDGYGSFPSVRDVICPIIWVFTPHYSDYGLTDPRLGKKIVMDKD